MPTLAMMANRRMPGSTSRRNSIRLPARSLDWIDSPVTLPPGRARLATMPLPTGSPAIANTIGIVEVACIAAVAALPTEKMTSTLSRTNSAANSANRSLRPSAQRYSIATVRPSIQPSSRSRCTKAAVHWLQFEGVLAPRNPMVSSLPGCCARAASGHAAAPPTRVMKSRRLIGRSQVQETQHCTGSNEYFDRARTTHQNHCAVHCQCRRWVKTRMASDRPYVSSDQLRTYRHMRLCERSARS